MITDLKLLPHTQIVARTDLGHVQISLENEPESLVVHLSGSVGGNDFSLPPKALPASSNTMMKAMAIGGLLKTGLEHLGAKAQDQPEGLPVDVTVKDGAQEQTQRFYLKLDMNALAQFQQVLTWVEKVNARVRG